MLKHRRTFKKVDRYRCKQIYTLQEEELFKCDIIYFDITINN